MALEVVATQHILDEYFDRAEKLFDLDHSMWEPLIDKPHIMIKRRYEDAIYNYYVKGTIPGISPETFYKVNLDLDYWTSWDPHVHELRVLEETQFGEQIIYWNVKYPWPLSNRDYVFAKKSKVDPEKGHWIVVSRACTNKKIPEISNAVRVVRFNSTLIMRANASKECEFAMQYWDDPRGSIPTWLVNWAVKTAIPDFIEKVKNASKGYPEYLERKKTAVAPVK